MRNHASGDGFHAQNKGVPSGERQSHVFFNPDADTPGCWVLDDQFCNDPHLLRYDLVSGTTKRIAEAAFEAELSAYDRDTGAVASFNQVGRRLVPADSNGDVTVYTRTTGESVRLRLPVGYLAPGDDGIPVVQWLDDDRFVLFANENRFDSPHEVGDLLVCRLPDGRCRVAVRASSTPYVAPGTGW